MSNSMTRQHFEALAERLKSNKPEVKIRKNSPTYLLWLRCVAATAIVCNGFNSSFDCDKFFKACGVED